MDGWMDGLIERASEPGWLPLLVIVAGRALSRQGALSANEQEFWKASLEHR